MGGSVLGILYLTLQHLHPVVILSAAPGSKHIIKTLGVPLMRLDPEPAC